MNVTTQDLVSQIGELSVENRALKLALADARGQLAAAQSRAVNAETLVAQLKGEAPAEASGEAEAKGE